MRLMLAAIMVAGHHCACDCKTWLGCYYQVSETNIVITVLVVSEADVKSIRSIATCKRSSIRITKTVMNWLVK